MNSAAVPRIIHQTWKTNEVPDEWRAYQASWIAQHPHWEYRLWTNADNRRLIAEQHPWFLATYDAFPRDIQRVDAAKYFILYTHGGVYADLDCECMKPFDDLLAGGGAFVSRTADDVIDCAILASAPGHALWRMVFAELQRTTALARMLRVTPGFQASHVLLTTGTRMMKRVVDRYQRSAESVVHRLTVLDASVCSSRSWLDRREPFTAPDTYVRHHYSDSWLLASERMVVAGFTRRRLRLAAAGLLALAGAVAWFVR